MNEVAQRFDKRRLWNALFRWLPALTSIIAALASVTVALISWNASRSTTDKDYVALAMTILSDKSSSMPSRRWAVSIVSKLSPVDIPQELASGLISGRSVLPSELDPNATRAAILDCMKPATSGQIVQKVPPAPLPADDGAEFKSWAIFAVRQTAQLEKANLNIEALAKVIDVCVRQPMTAVPAK